MHHYALWFKNLAPLSRPIRSKPKTSTQLFPALCGYVCLVRVLIGSLDCVSIVIGQRNDFSFAIRHSIENHSIVKLRNAFSVNNARNRRLWSKIPFFAQRVVTTRLYVGYLRVMLLGRSITTDAADSVEI